MAAGGDVVEPEELLERVWDEQADPFIEHRPHDGDDAAAQARRPAAGGDRARRRLPRVSAVRPTVRLRLTAYYTPLFVGCTRALLAAAYWLM